jgi:hypothetical protein
MDEYLRLFQIELNGGMLVVHCPHCDITLSEGWYPPVLWVTLYEDFLDHWYECAENIIEGAESLL